MYWGTEGVISNIPESIALSGTITSSKFGIEKKQRLINIIKIEIINTTKIITCNKKWKFTNKLCNRKKVLLKSLACCG